MQTKVKTTMIEDFDTEIGSCSAVATNTAKISFDSTSSTKLSSIETSADVNNISDVNATDLTDGGDTTLHSHAGISENTTHRSSNGNDHSNVVTNTAKVSYTKTNVKGQVVHGSTAGTARPTGFDTVEWIGSVEPTNATNNDTWIDTA